MRILILGRTEYLYDAAVALAEAGQTIVGIVTGPSMPEYQRREADFEQLADRLRCPYLFAKNIDAAVKKLVETAKPDIAVSMNWMSVIRKDFTSLFPRGVLNAHAGDVPDYRGNAVINWAIVRDCSQIGFTIHMMEPGELDSGAIVAKNYFPLTPRATITDVVTAMGAYFPRLFVRAVLGLEDGSIQPVPQSEGGFRCYPRLAIDSKINWHDRARRIDSLIRASTRPYAGAYSYLEIDGRIRKVIIWGSRVVATQIADIGSPGHIVKNDPATGESWVYVGSFFTNTAGIIALTEVEFADTPGSFQPGKVWKSIRMRFGVDVEDHLLRLEKRFDALAQRMNDIDQRLGNAEVVTGTPPWTNHR